MKKTCLQICNGFTYMGFRYIHRAFIWTIVDVVQMLQKFEMQDNIVVRPTHNSYC